MMTIPDRPRNTIILEQYRFGNTAIGGDSTTYIFTFEINRFSFTKGNKTGTYETVNGDIPYTPQS